MWCCFNLLSRLRFALKIRYSFNLASRLRFTFINHCWSDVNLYESSNSKKILYFFIAWMKVETKAKRNGELPSNFKKNQKFLNWWNEAESQLQNFKWNRNFQNSVAKYDGESPSKIETKTNILQILKQWHILLSHHQQICKILCKISPLGTEIGEKWAVNEENLIKLAISYL